MRSNAYLINTSRGAITDQDALVATLQAESVAGAGLDVLDHELLRELGRHAGVDALVHGSGGPGKWLRC
jgi:phosphoglycerate dehydrogenase-like enzyme